jgi:hypothetical protein
MARAMELVQRAQRLGTVEPGCFASVALAPVDVQLAEAAPARPAIPRPSAAAHRPSDAALSAEYS